MHCGKSVPVQDIDGYEKRHFRGDGNLLIPFNFKKGYPIKQLGYDEISVF